MISERLLRKWRKEALSQHNEILKRNKVKENWLEPILNSGEAITLNERILSLTQVLLDQHLLRRE